MERQDDADGVTLDDDQNDDSTIISTEGGSDGDTSQGTFDLDAVLSGHAGTINEDLVDDDDDDDSIVDGVKAVVNVKIWKMLQCYYFYPFVLNLRYQSHYRRFPAEVAAPTMRFYASDLLRHLACHCCLRHRQALP